MQILTDPADDPDFAVMSAHQLIDWLDTDFPHRCVGVNETELAAHRYAGKRELIDMLVSIKKHELAERA